MTAARRKQQFQMPIKDAYATLRSNAFTGAAEELRTLRRTLAKLAVFYGVEHSKVCTELTGKQPKRCAFACVLCVCVHLLACASCVCVFVNARLHTALRHLQPQHVHTHSHVYVHLFAGVGHLRG